MLGRVWLWVLVATVPAAASLQPPYQTLRPVTSAQHPQQFWKTSGRVFEFAEVPHTAATARCEDTRLPEALTTPDPLIVPVALGSEVKVSFIIGADGHVYSPLILKSGGPIGDRNIIQTVRSWRYRPATCNGVPTEIEGKIEFSRR
jgi:TonB family protein